MPSQGKRGFYVFAQTSVVRQTKNTCQKKKKKGIAELPDLAQLRAAPAPGPVAMLFGGQAVQQWMPGRAGRTLGWRREMGVCDTGGKREFGGGGGGYAPLCLSSLC